MEHLEFEKPIATLEKKLSDLRELAETGVDLHSEINALEKKLIQLTKDIYKNLTAWQKVQLSRHPNRPYSCDYIENIFPDFMELYGDRTFGNDKAILGGVASWSLPHFNKKNTEKSGASKKSTPDENTSKFNVLILAQQKGRTTKQKMERNFGMAKPEGYRKAMRLMDLAERFRMPLITFIDTPGAYPGIDAEERGQAQAIAESIRSMFTLTVPVIAIVIGEGGSGGALAIGVANRVLMQENSTYSVISPESCASILWSEAKYAERASEVLKMGPKDLLKLKVIDDIIPEPDGGAHRNWMLACEQIKKTIDKNLMDLFRLSYQQKGSSQKTIKNTPENVHDILKNKELCMYFKNERIKKFRQMGDIALAQTAQNGKRK